MRRALLLALVALLAVPAAAGAHARLVGTAPERGATLDRAPEQVVFRFSEPVEGAFGALRVFDAQAEQVDDRRITRPGGRTTEIAIGVRPDLPDGSYTATYRVISADGHPVSGGLVFSVGEAGAGPSRSVDELLGDEAGTVTRVALDSAKAVGYAATAVVLGGVVFLVVCAGGALGSVAFRRRVRRLLLAGAVVGAASSVLALALQGATASATTFWDALDPDVLEEVAGTRTGTSFALRAAAFALAGLAIALLAERRRAALAVLAAPLAVLAVGPAIGGHAGSTSPRGAMAALDVAHVLAMSVWLGGLGLLLFAVPAATRELELEQRTPLLAGVLVRFSPLALASVAVLLSTGVVQSIVHLTALDDLLDEAFGRAVLIKGALLAGLVALGWLNRSRTIPALRRAAAASASPAQAGVTLRRTLRAEVALVAVVLGVTGALTGTSPPASLAGGPVAERATMGPLQVEVTVDPAQTGPNELHLYFFDRQDGSQFDGAEEVTASIELAERDIELPVTLRKAGPGHFVADTLAIAPAGDWELEIVSRVSEFDEYRARVEVPVR